MSESVILCEGFLDRAFWAGWLGHFGCSIPINRDDEHGLPARKGQHMYLSKSDRFIRVIPCHGKRNVQKIAHSRLKRRYMQPRLTHLIINVDQDIDAHVETTATGLRLDDVLAIARKFDPSATKTDDSDIAMDDGATVVSLVLWKADDRMVHGIPNQQTLERLVCAAIVAAYPDRGPAVQKWLDARPGGPNAGPKEFGWSHMAGWYADHGCDAFYSALWEDQNVVAELKPRLVECGAWRIAEMLAE